VEPLPFQGLMIGFIAQTCYTKTMDVGWSRKNSPYSVESILDTGIQIRNRKERTHPISVDTPIIRYMKLETFLLLLAGRVFIPSLELLSSLDPLEGKLMIDLPQKFWESNSDVSSHVGGTLAKLYHRQTRATGPVPYSFTRISRGPIEDRKDDFQLWLSELARERSVWCWNRFEKQSHAMWQLYGSRGVAVRSTIGRVAKALHIAGVQRGNVAPVSYIDIDQPPSGNMLLTSEDSFRPYLLKSANFEYEDEIRFVLRVQHEVVRVRKGVLINIDTPSIFDAPTQVLISPQLQREEHTAVRDAIGSLLCSEELVKKLNEDRKKINESDAQYLFPSNDQTPGIFPDLD
jgi:hypothetical protein